MGRSVPSSMGEDHHQGEKQAEERLKADIQRYKQLAGLTTEGLMVHVSGVILDANHAFAQIVGCADPEELIGKNALDVIPATQKSHQCISTHLLRGCSDICEVDLIMRDGTTIPFEISCSRIEYQAQDAHVVFLRDIKERKQAEARMNRQLERLNVLHSIDQAVASSMDLHSILHLFIQKIVEQIQIDACAVLLYNSQTQTLDFVDKEGFWTKALEFTHLKLGNGLAGRAAQEKRVIYIPDLAEVDNNPVLTKAIADENFRIYVGIPLIAKNNLLGVLEIFHRSKLTADPGWLKFLEILANEATIAIDNARLLGLAQQSYKETNALYQINKKLIATVDPQELMDDVVNLLHESFGYHYVQIFVVDPKTGNFIMRAGSGELGKLLRSEGYYLSAGDGIVGSTAETGKPFFTNRVEDVITFIRPPHLTETNSELAVPIRIGEKFIGLLDIHQITTINLTERDVQLVTAVADQLAVALQKADLYTNLQESLRHEQATRFQLIHNEKLTVAGRLLASVSHELNNPIQAIQNALFLLKEEKGISTQGKQDLEIVLSETDRMATMLQRLRTTYRPVSAADYKPVDINEIIQDVGALVSTHLRHNRIAYEYRPESKIPFVSGLDDQLRQVILNLVMNSVEAMTDGGRLVITTRFEPIEHEIEIAVSDTGSGIDEMIYPNIFEAFVTNKEHGTGLGLTISNEIVLKHGGRIHAENNQQGGATIHVWLPTIHAQEDL